MFITLHNFVTTGTQCHPKETLAVFGRQPAVYLIELSFENPFMFVLSLYCIVHTTSYNAVYFHCLHVRLLRMALHINQSINQSIITRTVRTQDKISHVSTTIASVCHGGIIAAWRHGVPMTSLLPLLRRRQRCSITQMGSAEGVKGPEKASDGASRGRRIRDRCRRTSGKSAN